MKKRETMERTAAEVADAQATGQTLAVRPKVYVVECDAYELPEFYERRNELVPSFNMHSVEEIFTRSERPKGWYGESCKSWDDAKKLLHKGWPAGVKRAEGLVSKLQGVLPEPESARRKTRWNDDDAGELDREKLYASGVETAFRGTTRVRMRAPRVIRIVANWSMNCSYTGDQIVWNGAAITALLDTLERADYSTELSLVFGAKHTTHNGADVEHQTMPIVRVKTAGDPLSLNTIAAVAGHAGIFRSYGFAASCTTPNKVDYSLGRPTQVKECWEMAMKANVVESVDAYMELASTEEMAIDQMVSVLKHLFPEIEGLPPTAKERERARRRANLHIQFPKVEDFEKSKAKTVKMYGQTWWDDYYGSDNV